MFQALRCCHLIVQGALVQSRATLHAIHGWQSDSRTGTYRPSISFPFPILFHHCSILHHSCTPDVVCRSTEYPTTSSNNTHSVNLWPVWSNESCRIPTNKYYINVRDCFSYSDCNNILLHSTHLSTTTQAQHQTTQGYCLWIKTTGSDINVCRQ